MPTHTSNYPLAGRPKEQMLVLAMEAATQLAWPLHYLSRSGLIAACGLSRAQVTVRIDADSMSITSTSPNSGLRNRGKNKRNIAEFVVMLNKLGEAFSEEALLMKYEELSPFFPPPEADMLRLPPRKEATQAADLLAIFKPVSGYFVTPLILNINILVFVLMAINGISMLEPGGADLLAWGANMRPFVAAGQWWRLITACFLHIGILHLAMNMYAFLLIGAQLERRLGKRRFLTAYLLTGIVASLTSIWWHERTISAGASGAIFGMYGVFLALLTTDLVEKSNRKQLLASILFFIVYNLLGGLQAGIDNAAHLGGLLAGVAIGYSFVPALRRVLPEPKKAEPAPEIPDYY